MRHILRYVLCNVGCILLISGCTDDGIYFFDSKIVGKWPSENALVFQNISVEKPTDLGLTVHHTSTYGFENLYLKVTVVEAQDTLYDEVISIDLMDNFGKWKGKRKQQKYSISTDLLILKDSPSTLDLSILQYSREEILSGIDKIDVYLKSLSAKEEN